MAVGKRGRATPAASDNDNLLVYGLTDFERTLVRDALDDKPLAELAADRHVSATSVAAELRLAVQKLMESVAQPSGGAARVRYMRRGALVGAMVDRQAGERGLKAAMTRATRSGSPFSVVYLCWRLEDDQDVPGARDDAGTWRRMGYLVANNVRPDDLCIRWSDTAALVVLEHTTESQAHIVARRLGQAEEGANLGIGVAERAASEDVPRLVHRAREAASKMLLDLRAQRRLSSGYRF